MRARNHFYFNLTGIKKWPSKVKQGQFIIIHKKVLLLVRTLSFQIDAMRKRALPISHTITITIKNISMMTRMFGPPFLELFKDIGSKSNNTKSLKFTNDLAVITDYLLFQIISNYKFSHKEYNSNHCIK
jgi:hypothetical protein